MTETQDWLLQSDGYSGGTVQMHKLGITGVRGREIADLGLDWDTRLQFCIIHTLIMSLDKVLGAARLASAIYITRGEQLCLLRGYFGV